MWRHYVWPGGTRCTPYSHIRDQVLYSRAPLRWDRHRGLAPGKRALPRSRQRRARDWSPSDVRLHGDIHARTVRHDHRVERPMVLSPSDRACRGCDNHNGAVSSVVPRSTCGGARHRAPPLWGIFQPPARVAGVERRCGRRHLSCQRPHALCALVRPPRIPRAICAASAAR